MKMPGSRYNNDTFGKIKPKGTTKAQPASSDGRPCGMPSSGIKGKR